MKTLFKNSITSSIHKSYDIGSQIGTGKFSIVKSATEKSTGKQWALKMMRKSVVEEQNIIKEVEIMMDTSHSNVIALHEIYETDNEIILVLELVTGGELFDKIVERNSYTEEDASKLINTLTKVIYFLHNKDIVHCDLKPENLLYSDNTESAVIKLCDFGLSQRCPSGTTLRSLVGTQTYMAPEIPACSGYGKPVDMWALGVIIYILLCGYPPFDETTGFNLEFPSPDWDNISDTAKGLIKALLVVDSTKRLTAAQTLKNVWVSGVSTGKQSIIGTLKTLREFNTLRRSGTTMGHNRTVRGTVFELFPSLNNQTESPTPIKPQSQSLPITPVNQQFFSPIQPVFVQPLPPNDNQESCNNNNNEKQNGGSESPINNKLNNVRICNSNSSSSGNLIKELEMETTTFQDILKKQLMNSLEAGTDSSFDSSSETSSTSNLADSSDRFSPELLASSLNGASSLLEYGEKQKLSDQLQAERETNARLIKEIEDLKKQQQQRVTNGMTYSLPSNPSMTAGLVMSSHSRNNSTDSTKDKSRHGVDRIVGDLQTEFDKLFLSKETLEKLNNVMSTYKQKNQEKSLKVELERQKEKYKKLKIQLKTKSFK